MRMCVLLYTPRQWQLQRLQACRSRQYRWYRSEACMPYSYYLISLIKHGLEHKLGLGLKL